MKNLFLKLLVLGEENAEGVTAKRKVKNINIIVLITIVSYLVYSSIYLIMAKNNTVLFNSAIIIFIFFPLSLITPLLNKYGKLRLARWAISLNFTGVILFLMIFGQANYFNAHFFFLAFCSALFTYFPLSQWRDISFFFTLNLCLFIISHFGIFEPYPEAHLVTPFFTLFLSILNIVVSTLILGGMIYLSEYATSQSDGELEMLSTTDSLTGLLNRHGFMARFEEECARCKRSGNYGALLFFDLNNFKLLNDEYGHSVGDQLLQQVALRLRGLLRKTDVVGRFGGDEFIALMCQTGEDENHTLTQARSTVEIIRSSLAKKYKLEVSHNLSSKIKNYNCSSSIGIATFNGASNIEEVLKKADKAMYDDKNANRNVN